PDAQGGGDAHVRQAERFRAAGPEDSGSASSAAVAAPRAAAAMSDRPAGWPSSSRCPVPREAATPCLLRAASRRAQSWKIGHAAKFGERQYASWWANA